MQASKAETKPVWVYVIFRKNHCSGHEKMTVNLSFDGPIFWNRQVAYIYCCSCHFDEHEVSIPSGYCEQRVLNGQRRVVHVAWHLAILGVCGAISRCLCLSEGSKIGSAR